MAETRFIRKQNHPIKGWAPGMKKGGLLKSPDKA